jgi:protein-S-isoprenylcysteine O-methyltransferase Ste14
MKSSFKTSWQSLLFVFIQFFCLFFIGLTGPLIPDSILLLGIELLGLGLGLWAVAAMRVGNFNIAPEPLKWSKFVARGPYQLIRHPMYLALLVATIPLVIADFSFIRLGIWIMLLVNLLLKMRFEESMLLIRFDDYDSYIKGTARILPGIY